MGLAMTQTHNGQQLLVSPKQRDSDLKLKQAIQANRQSSGQCDNLGGKQTNKQTNPALIYVYRQPG